MCSSGHVTKLQSSVSDQNVFLTYVCLVDGKPNPDENRLGDERKTSVKFEDDLDEDRPIQVERSKALHELVESHRYDDDIYGESTTKSVTYKTTPSITIIEQTNENEIDDPRNHANILRLTKMKWLTEGQHGSTESSSPSLSPTNSTASTCSRESDDVQSKINPRLSFGDKCLSTILRMDKEHNMFGLSNIAVIGKQTSRRSRKEDEKPVFPQTAIVQICCRGGGCCRHKSITDLPASLKCGGCRRCCNDPYNCPHCSVTCGPMPCDVPPCPSVCSTCPSGNCKVPCGLSKCLIDSSNCFGFKIELKRKPRHDPSPVELTPRSSCIMQKPVAARTCTHTPHCLPPSSCFPYLMPCYWPSRPGAPCNHPSRCFHTPPCREPRIPLCHNQETCAKQGKCTDNETGKCTNKICPQYKEESINTKTEKAKSSPTPSEGK